MPKRTVSQIIAIAILNTGAVYAQPQPASPITAALETTPPSLARVSTSDDRRNFGDYFLEANRGYIIGRPRHISFRRTIAPVRYGLVSAEQFPVVHSAGRLLCENANGSFLLVCQRADGRRWRSRHYRCAPESEANPLLLFPSDCVRHDVWTIEGRPIQLPEHIAPIEVAAQPSALSNERQRPAVQWPTPVVENVRDALNTAARLPNGAARVATSLIRGVTRSFDGNVPVVTPEPHPAPTIRHPTPIAPATRVSPPAQETTWLRNILLVSAMVLYGVMGFFLLRFAGKAQRLEAENKALKKQPMKVATYPSDATTLPPSENIEATLREVERMLREKETALKTTEELSRSLQKQLSDARESARRGGVVEDRLQQENTELKNELARVREDVRARHEIEQKKDEQLTGLRRHVATLREQLTRERNTARAEAATAEQRAASYWQTEVDRWRDIAGIYYQHCLTGRLQVPSIQMTESRLSGLATIPPAPATPSALNSRPPPRRTATDSIAPPLNVPPVRPPAAAGYPAGPAGTAPDESGHRASSPRYEFGVPDTRDTAPYAVSLDDSGVPSAHRAPTALMQTGTVESLRKMSSNPPEKEDSLPANHERHPPLAGSAHELTGHFKLSDLLREKPPDDD